jgi:hypothetical protein
MNRKPFQDATVRRASRALRDARNARRFLVADEVGLGKTRVAQGVLEAMCETGTHLDVFYVCSSLSIIHQNRDALLDFLEPDLAAKAKISVDRLTLLPTSRPSKDVPLTLYTLTPGTIPGGRRTGRADERAVMWHLLCTSVDGLARHGTLAQVFRRNVGSWDADLARARESTNTSVARTFRGELAVALNLAKSSWSTTIIEAMKALAERDSAGLIGRCRVALATAGLQMLSPDLIIFDEFQRFFDLLVPGEDDDPVARQLVDLLLREGDAAGPSVLLLSATPYRTFSGWGQDAEGHYDQFFKLLGFLFGRAKGPAQVAALREELREYRQRLQHDPVGTREIVAVRNRIERSLTRVMSRTERPRRIADQERLHFDRSAAPLQPMDIRLFRHLADSAAVEDRSDVPAYWMSIPYPLQMMDRTYQIFRRKTQSSLAPESRDACVYWKQVRRYEPIVHSHAKLRQLIERVPAKSLALPWLPPTLPWWPLGGVFNSDGEAKPSKTLLFSRFKAVPRAIASVLSYEAERFCFSPNSQRLRGTKPVGYEYRTEPGQRPAVGLKKRPARSFVFPVTSKLDTGMRTLSMFAPMPELAALGDPIGLLGSESAESMEGALSVISERIANRLGRSDSTQRPQATWPWVAELERSGGSWLEYMAGLRAALPRADQTDAEDGGTTDSRSGVERAVKEFLDSPRPARAPSEKELRALAEIALLAPGNVLFRAVTRVFGNDVSVQERIELVSRASLWALAPYLDQPDFHLLLRQRDRRQHPEAVRRAVWDGNLESVLDEYLSSVRGLGVATVPRDVEERSLASLTRALRVGVASVTVHETGKDIANESFRMRCHAALPFGLGRQEMSDEAGAFHYDDLRMAFNSPFRPHVLATTSIGQEGLDFHVWCNHVLHWDLPSNPVDLEQREGRIDRYGGLAVRQALAEQSPELSTSGSPWQTLAERQVISDDGLSPWWVCAGAKIRRTVLIPPLSAMEGQLDDLLDQLSLYRLALGQTDQEALVHALHRRLGDAGEEREAAADWFDLVRIDLAANSSRASPGDA